MPAVHSQPKCWNDQPPGRASTLLAPYGTALRPGPCPPQLADLTAMYKSRLTPEGQRQFVQLVKQVAKMEPGSRYLVLKE